MDTPKGYRLAAIAHLPTAKSESGATAGVLGLPPRRVVSDSDFAMPKKVVTAVGDRHHSRGDGVPIRNHLDVVESERQVSERVCDGISVEIADALATITVVLLAVDLHDQTVSNEEVDAPDPFDLDLRSHVDTELGHPIPKN